MLLQTQVMHLNSHTYAVTIPAVSCVLHWTFMLKCFYTQCFYLHFLCLVPIFLVCLLVSLVTIVCCHDNVPQTLVTLLACVYPCCVFSPGFLSMLFEYLCALCWIICLDPWSAFPVFCLLIIKPVYLNLRRPLPCTLYANYIYF